MRAGNALLLSVVRVQW